MLNPRLHRIIFALLALTIVWQSQTTCCAAEPSAPREFSGIYPRLAQFNDENECGTGAVVAWAGKLWTISYGPHLPLGSSDKLYELDDSLARVIRDESVGGTHANRMIHRETNQLFIGSHAIDAASTIVKPSRHTGSTNAACAATAPVKPARARRPAALEHASVASSPSSGPR